MMKNIKYYPIEVLHWAGMNDTCLPKLKHILTTHPEYINAKNQHGDNALMIAARTGNYEIIKYLIKETNLDRNAFNDEGNALTIACKYQRYEIALYLIENDLNLDCVDNNGCTPLFFVSRDGNDMIVEKLQEKGANFQHLNNNNRNAMFYFIDGYIFHQNYFCFELLNSYIQQQVLLQKDKEGIMITSYISNKMNNTNATAVFTPLLFLLE